MGRRQHSPTTPVGITNKQTRRGRQVLDAEGNVLLDAKSLRQAKRFFRTGSKGNDPVSPKASSRSGAYIPQGRKP